jgi:acyl-CoA hydrolase
MLTSAKLASSSVVEMIQLVMPSDANTLGTAFGGKVMQWIDLCASVSARRHAGVTCVTASIDSLNFLAPIKIGSVAILHARVNAVFGTSMEVGVDVMVEEPETGTRSKCCDAFLTFVALGSDGKPARAPLLLAQSPEEEERVRQAQARRAARLSGRRAFPAGEKDGSGL